MTVRKQSRRRWLWILGGVLTLLFLLPVLLPAVVDLNRFRPVIAERVSRALGRPVSFGAIRLSVLGRVGAEVEDVRVVESPAFGAEPFIAADALRVTVATWPLLRGGLEVRQIELQGPRLRIIRNRAGRWNYQDFLSRGAGVAPGTSPVEADPRPRHEPGTPLPLPSAGLRVRGGEVSVVDQTRPGLAPFTLTDLDLTVEPDKEEQPVAFSLRARRPGPQPTRITIQGRGGPLPGAGTLLTIPFEAWFTAKDVALPLVASYLGGGGEGWTLDGRVGLRGRVQGKGSLIGFQGEMDLTRARIESAFFRKGAGDQARVFLEGVGSADRVVVSSLQLHLPGARFTGKGTLSPGTVPRLTFSLSAPVVDLDRLLMGQGKRAARTWVPIVWAAERVSPGTPPPRFLSAGRVEIGELRWRGLELRDVGGDLSYQRGVLRVEGLDAKVSGGRLRGDLRIDLNRHPARVGLASHLEAVRIAPILVALVKPDWTLDGLLTLKGDLEGPAAQGARILQKAFGKGHLLIRQGRLTGFKPAEKLGQVLAPVLAARGIALAYDRFDRLEGSYEIAGGQLATRDLVLVQGPNRFRVAGRLRLDDSQLDFDVTAEGTGYQLTAKVLGTVARPRVIPSRVTLERRIEEKIDRALRDDQQRKIKEFFRDLMKQR